MTAQECQAAYARLSALLRRTAPRAYAVEVLRHPKCLSDGLMVLDCVGEPLDLSQVPAEVLDQLLHLVGHGQWQLAFSESLQFYP
ncbi:hypothetical protein Dxin01_00820 [Deinococcus xinjiangensis]|uniref:Uncharacterized protein n=2 Tax=Deinococcus xinjiangensis TaxID=457454 RepID=A0ABP9V740_9DEIO